MRGRKPAPTALKLLKGVRSDRINQAEPTPRREPPDKPDWISDRAGEFWDRIAPELFDAGILTVADGPALTILVVTLGMWRDALDLLELHGMTTLTEKGDERPHPAVRIAFQCERQILQLLVEFGMTPASRSKVSAILPTVDDPLATYLGERQVRGSH
jgi:P27 family predicted phage terminase small subunit